jgi:hypothetical protein
LFIAIKLPGLASGMAVMTNSMDITKSPAAMIVLYNV